jgi:predicted nucleotidyltransferase
MSVSLGLSPKSQIELEQRRQQALVAAERCMQLLQSDFGATEVFLCGSLAGESPWHWHSDIDIAVRGMSKDAVWDAYSAIEDFVPHWHIKMYIQRSTQKRLY